MAHYAEIKDGIVQRVIVVSNEDEQGSEEKGIAFCKKLLGGEWVKTSYNNKIRKKYASIGDIYDKEKDIFISPQPFPSWTLDKNGDWQPPIPYPKDGNEYEWDENEQKWIIYVFEKDRGKRKDSKVKRKPSFGMASNLEKQGLSD